MASEVVAGREYRALMMLHTLPRGCVGVSVFDDDGEPHLKKGEVAVVDPEDREPANGELFLIRWEGGREAFVSVKEREGCWMIGAPGHPWARAGKPRPMDQAVRLAQRFGAVDGPIRPDYLREKLVGRVMGIMAPEPIRIICELCNWDGGGRALDARPQKMASDPPIYRDMALCPSCRRSLDLIGSEQSR